MTIQYFTCDVSNIQPDGSCSQPVWVDAPTILPPLSVEDAGLIWTAIAVMWCIGFGVREVRRVLWGR